MKVSPGMRLGRYEIGASIGAGGMGEVFHGLDTLLNRPVAIKVLPERVANDSDARQRFEREARLLASLSHPNILAIHDFGTEQGVAFAVMELLEGETLRQRLRRALPAETALDYALGIARGLAAAHAKGVIHRDLKPDNIFLPIHGSVKILDFGLARLDAPMTNDADTGQLFSTQPGLIIGTVGYMSPEQLLGLDTRCPRRHLLLWRRAARDALGTAAVCRLSRGDHERRAESRSASRCRSRWTSRAASCAPASRRSRSGDINRRRIS